MAFRADEAASDGFEHAKRRMIPRSMVGQDRLDLANHLAELVQRLGPVVSSYPAWHPLVPQPGSRDRYTTPGERNGWQGLDHTIYFVNGFLTCPYAGSKALEMIEQSAMQIRQTSAAGIDVEVLDQPYYGEGTTPILVTCEWDVELENGYMIPKSRAIPLMLEIEVPAWRYSQVAETWDNMLPYLIGSPHGARSSLFVTQDTGMAMKKIYEMLISSGMYGPVFS